jgi:hypothetical protein
MHLLFIITFSPGLGNERLHFCANLTKQLACQGDRLNAKQLLIHKIEFLLIQERLYLFCVNLLPARFNSCLRYCDHCPSCSGGLSTCSHCRTSCKTIKQPALEKERLMVNCFSFLLFSISSGQPSGLFLRNSIFPEDLRERLIERPFDRSDRMG